MKRCLLFFAFIAICTTAFSQDAETNEASLSALDTTAFYGNSSKRTEESFKIKREPLVFRRVFLVTNAPTEKEVYKRALAFAETLSAKLKTGKTKNKIVIPLTWKHAGGFNECIENLDLSAKLTIEVKHVKTRISLSDITYVHRDKDDDDIKPVAKTSFFSRQPDCAPSKGKAELLYNCDACSTSLKSIDKNFQNEFELMADTYQDWLRNY